MLTNNPSRPVYDGIPARYRQARAECLAADLLGKIKTAVRTRGIALTGAIGVGKTYAMAVACRAAGSEGWLSWPDFLVDQEWHLDNNRAPDSHRFEPMRWAKRYTGHLFIDDVGAEPPTGAYKRDLRQLFSDLVRERYDATLAVHLTTNLTGAQIEEEYGARTLSRLVEMCTWINVEGADRRFPNA